MEKENSKTPITPISEEKLENEDSNHDPFKLSQSNIINPLQSPNFAVNPTGNKQKLDKKNEIFHSQVSANINALKSFKNKSSCLKQLTNAEPAKMKSMDSKSGTSYAFQFSSILDSNADLQSEMKTEKIIKENKGFNFFYI